jgi:hypothetical protein
MQELREVWARPVCKLLCLVVLVLLLGLVFSAIFLTKMFIMPEVCLTFGFGFL